MKKYKIFLVAAVMGLMSSEFVKAASVKGKLNNQADEVSAQKAAAEAEAATGHPASVVRDYSGKVVEIQVDLPENDNSGIAKATAALISNQGVATVVVEQSKCTSNYDDRYFIGPAEYLGDDESGEAICGCTVIEGLSFPGLGYGIDGSGSGNLGCYNTNLE